MKKIKGKAWKFGDNIDTDVIIPARYLNTTDPEELAKHCMEDIDPEFFKKINKGDIIVAGKNFGCGSSREHAPIAIKASGIACVIAESFARIFYRNAFNTGLLILECPEAVKNIETGDELEIYPEEGKIINLTKNKTYFIKPLPPFMKEILEDGGLIPHIMKRFEIVHQK
ncbi:MAG: 3-isopropylmalate dehydratase small subunit [Thermodesulfobacteria bacterium]|nr:3-isopropylmalate dehydratase small subunit [Thermodesulfobacteriota bacterium]MCU4138344.1 3-isopropylmalate dehydratase small subunit [Thermodesulfobacteriota bacterium]